MGSLWCQFKGKGAGCERVHTPWVHSDDSSKVKVQGVKEYIHHGFTLMIVQR